MSDENLKNESTWGGRREGAGRPAGSKNLKTKEQEIIEEALRQRILSSTEHLLNSQMNLALGVQMLYRIDVDEKGAKKKPELVTSQQEIEQFLAGEFDGTDSEYYFITTERPDNKAIDSMFDRVFGKAIQRRDITTKGEKIAISSILDSIEG